MTKCDEALRLLDVEAAISFLEHSKNTHERWAEWLQCGGPASPEAGDLEHHKRCVLEYEHILDTFLADKDIPAAREAVNKQLTDDELTAFIPERLMADWQESRTHPHCKWDADAVVDFLRELALSRAFRADTSPAAAALLEELEQLRHKVQRALIHLETSYASVQAARAKLEEE